MAESVSYAEVLKALGLSVSGGNYASLKHYIGLFGISTEHMTHQGHSRGKVFKTRKGREALTDKLRAGTLVNTHALKLSCWKYGLLDRRCYECGLTQWRGQDAPLQLDHINGERTDNRLENLRILCPNCHAQTDTWTGKNQKRAKENAAERAANPLPPSRLPREPRHCVDCGKSVSQKAERCKSCATKRQPTAIEWPSNEELLARLEESNFSALARELGVSDNAIRKRLARAA